MDLKQYYNHQLLCLIRSFWLNPAFDLEEHERNMQHILFRFSSFSNTAVCEAMQYNASICGYVILTPVIWLNKV